MFLKFLIMFSFRNIFFDGLLFLRKVFFMQKSKWSPKTFQIILIVIIYVFLSLKKIIES